MVKIFIQNARSHIEGRFHEDPLVSKQFGEALRTALGYMVPGVEWSPKYKQGLWDGIISLYNRRESSFPTGCLKRVTTALHEFHIPFELVDLRERPKKTLEMTTSLAQRGLALFPYQEAAVDAAMKAGRGVIALATGGGKTFTTCELLCRMGVGPVIVIVPTRSLLKQTHSEFEGALLDKDGQPVKVGMIGDGLCDIVPDGINIAIYHSGLQSFSERFLEGKQEVVVDELAGEGTKKTTEQLEAEFSAADAALQGAITRTAPALRDLHSARKAAESVRDTAAEGHSQGKVTQKEADKARTAFEKCDRAVERERNKLVKAERDAEAKARKALADRKVSLDRKARVRDLFARAQGFLVDEAHLASVVIETLGSHAPNAYYRIGLSATPWREDNQEIRIEGALGRKLVDISATELIEGGYLIAPTIFMVRIDHVEASEDYGDLYRKHVTNGWQRNFRIKQFAEAFKAAGMPVMVLVERVEHGEVLQDMIQDSLFVAGSDKGEDDPDSDERDFRKRMLDECAENKLILIATSWAYTGVNVPALSTLILAGSNQSTVTTYQQVGRVLRRHAPSGKSCAVVVDFLDEEPTLHKHAVRRKKVYKHEAAFTVKTVS